MTISAAEEGSAGACLNLALWYFDGMYGLPKDRAEGMYWLFKALSRRCAVEDLNSEQWKKAHELVRTLMQ